MNKTEICSCLNNILLDSEYYLQLTLDSSGVVLNSSTSLVPVDSYLEKKETPLTFKDFFLSAHWEKFQESIKFAKQFSQPSFTIELQQRVGTQLNYSKWEFFFISESSEACRGIGHPTSEKVYDTRSDEFLENMISEEPAIIEGILKNKLLGYWEFDLNGKSNKINEDIFEFLGYDHTDITLKENYSWEDCIHSDDYLDLKNHIENAQSTLFKKKFRLIKKDNQPIWVFGFGKLISRNEFGKLTKFHGCILDISAKNEERLMLKEYHYLLNEIAFDQSHTLRAKVANILGILEIVQGESNVKETQSLFNLLKTEAHLLDNYLKKSIEKTSQKNQTIQRIFSID